MTGNPIARIIVIQAIPLSEIRQNNGLLKYYEYHLLDTMAPPPPGISSRFRIGFPDMGANVKSLW